MQISLLLIDDDAVDREAVRRALRAARVAADVVDAASAEAAFAVLAGAAVDCILLDYHLPGSDGLTVLRQLKAQGVEAPVIALTGQGDEQTAVEMMKAGAADYLSKQSLTPDRLERSLRHALMVAVVERERRDLLAREQAARQEAQAANRVKDEFLATLSHELRTPLNSILGWSRLLTTGQLDPEAFRRGLQTIERNALLQAKLIDDLLDISRIITGKLTVESQPVSLAAVVAAALESQRPSADAGQITLRCSSDGHEWPVMGDAARLQQVVTNLLSNAIKFTPKGGTVDIELKYADQQVLLTVRDTGIGIDPQFLPHVFERFRQADASPTRRHSGLGLGLAIVKHLVELHGGQVAVDSAGANAGSTFRVSLPIVPAMAARVADTRVESGSLSGTSVLVVDDDDDSRTLVAEILERCGATVRTASNGAEAMALAREHAPDVVLSDIAMPGADGYSLVRELRTLSADRAVPAAAITAFASPQDRSRALAAGFQAHIAKPCDPGALVTTVRALVRGRPASARSR